MKREVNFINTAESISLAEHLAILCKSLDASTENSTEITEAA